MESNIYIVRIQPEDIDTSGHVTIPALYRKAISSVSLNICKEGYGVDVMDSLGLSWALARCAFEFTSRPCMYTEIEIGIYRGTEMDLSYGRNIEIRSSEGELIGSGTTDWCTIGKSTRRPVRLNLESDLEARRVSCGQPRRLRPFSGGTEASGFAGYSECDFNGHLNNCRYVDWFFNLLPGPVRSMNAPVRMDVNFRNEIMCGSGIVASSRKLDDRTFGFCLRHDGGIACLASLQMM